MADNALNRRNALMDASQGVSKGFWADGIGGPVDMMTTLANLGIAGGGYAGHKLGLLSQPPELIQNPVGGSEWIAAKMRSNGLLNDNPGSTADAYGRVAGGLLAPLTAARAPQIANALQQAPAALQRGAYAVGERAAGMAENQLVRQGGILPATVWHGSPHKFDKFDASKIGTGEGIQAYGHGLYLAESPGVAKSYQTGLSGQTALVDGKVTKDLTTQVVGNQLQQFGGDIAKTKQYFLAKAAESERNGRFYKPALKDADQFKQYADEVEALAGKAFGRNEGSLYKVDLPDEQIAKMLNWDKPVSDVQRMPLSEAAMKQFGSGLTSTSGEHLYKEVVFEFKSAGHPNPTQAATDWLRENGTPGIRYLDGGSRSSGKGSSNFVVFPGNEGMLSILERNGRPIK